MKTLLFVYCVLLICSCEDKKSIPAPVIKNEVPVYTDSLDPIINDYTISLPVDTCGALSHDTNYAIKYLFVQKIGKLKKEGSPWLIHTNVIHYYLVPCQLNFDGHKYDSTIVFSGIAYEKIHGDLSDIIAQQFGIPVDVSNIKVRKKIKRQTQ